MRHRLTVERKSTTQDAYGAESESWVELLTRRCSVEFAGGREFLVADQESSQLRALFRLRYDAGTAGIVPRDRIVFDGEYWDIQTITNTRAINREIQITAVRGTYDQ